MIRIYADEPGCFELVVRENGLEVYSVPVYLAARELPKSQGPRRRIGLVTAVLLVAMSAGAGYFIAPRSSPTHATSVADAAPPLPNDTAPPFPTVGPTPPAPGPQALADALATRPSVTPPSGPEPANPPGVAAFGLQP